MDKNDGNMKAILAFVEVVQEYDLVNKRVCIDPFSHAPGLLMTVYFTEEKLGIHKERFCQIATTCINSVFFDSETHEVIKGFLKSRIDKIIVETCG